MNADMRTIDDIRHNNLETLIAELGGANGGVTRLAELMGHNTSSQVSQWRNRSPNSETGKPRVLSTASARKLEQVCGKPAGWMDIDHDHAGTQGTATAEPGPALRQRVPLISWTRAGHWAEVIDTQAPGVADDWIPTTARVGVHAYALRIRGDSMEPTIPDGAVVIVDPDTQPDPGRIVIVRQNSDRDATIKRLVADGGRYYLRPDNPRYPILEMGEDAVICGVVRQVVLDMD